MRMGSAGSRVVCLVFLAAFPSLAAQELCDPGAEARGAIAQALASAPQDAPLEERLAPLRALRDQLERDLFVHLGYQDAIFDQGIEGHLKAMLEEYLRLQAQHPDDPFYLYLSARAFEGRGTRRSIAMLEQVLALDPDYSPAHRTLAEIYRSRRFRDRAKEAAARRRFHAACPGGIIARRPPPLPPHSTYFARLRESKPTPELEEAIPAEVQKALQQDEWRALRIRLFDWYEPAEQQKALHDLQAEYWQAWRVLVRHYRRTGQQAKADELLAEMEERMVRLQQSRRATTFALAARTVLGLYAEANQSDNLRAALARLQTSLHEHPDAKRAAELARVQAAFASDEGSARR
jgi:hypothetical protein